MNLKMINKENVKKYFKSIPCSIWILGVIILVGIFLRTYNFSQWLYFYPDQARDVMTVDGVISGKTALPLLDFKAASTNFQLGAMYAYFQIISAKIFGSSPATMAYPDVLFGVLSIPLLYYFLRKYFSISIALAMAGLYSVSFYAIRYSRFAWNVNPIPFFVLLFLLSLYEFIIGKEKTRWWWIALAGIALGVGIQLHTVLLVLLPLVSFLVFIYTMKSDWRVWKKWVIIFLIALILNTGQLVSGIRTNFQNTRYFFNVFNDRSSENDSIANNLVSNVICQAQANTLYLSSLENNDTCDTPAYFKYDKDAKQNHIKYGIRMLNISFGLILLLMGYALLVYYARKETDKNRKMFLYLNLIYSFLTFLVILPIITHNGQVRYWLPIIFLPFLFLGLVAHFFSEKIPKKYYWVGILFLVFLIGTNFSTIFSETKQFASKSRSNAQYVVLGELETIESYIEAQSFPQKEAYIFGGQKYMQNFYSPLFYVSSKNNFTIFRQGKINEVPSGKPVFFIAQSLDAWKNSAYDSMPSDFGFSVESYKGFGNVGVYKIKN